MHCTNFLFWNGQRSHHTRWRLTTEFKRFNDGRMRSTKDCCQRWKETGGCIMATLLVAIVFQFFALFRTEIVQGVCENANDKIANILEIKCYSLSEPHETTSNVNRVKCASWMAGQFKWWTIRSKWTPSNWSTHHWAPFTNFAPAHRSWHQCGWHHWDVSRVPCISTNRKRCPLI